MQRNDVLGVDVGSVFLHAVQIEGSGRIVHTARLAHGGDIVGAVRTALAGLRWERIKAIAATASSPELISAQGRYDERLCLMEAVRRLHGRVGGILAVGGERFSLISFAPDGSYCGCKTNTSCAAGTGSFLDQQARRLNLSGIEELAAVAMRNKGVTPQIASRCAVFAKTDVIHAQQEGLSLEEICDGLCAGLARNIVSTLFTDGCPPSPLIFAGGVALNRAVARHIEALIGRGLVVSPLAPFFGALGAALSGLEEGIGRESPLSLPDVLAGPAPQKAYFYGPLKPSLSRDLPAPAHYEFIPPADGAAAVEVDLYEGMPRDGGCEAFLGIDIGSTSTKAVLCSPEGEVLAGFYTRTAGRPVAATQHIAAAVEALCRERNVDLSILGAGTTGSGRKFIGKIIGADLIVDEITAHARAAVAVRPDVDTIIEIGGQDSKFTTLRDGAVTFSVMNTVCAAGTGSFIEEQAQRLGCLLSDYAARVEGRSSPLTSNRCTVFMERDLNSHLRAGYEIDEVLAAVLHAIAENYLSKVAVEAAIGKTIIFQGATAKNRGLVAAFEQRLGKKILVSPYCHLAGAWGVALLMAEAKISRSRFRGLSFHRLSIPVTSETCNLCPNCCKITVAHLKEEKVAYGFLCGRDYDEGRFVDNNRSGFDLIKERRRHFAVPRKQTGGVTVGLPACLHLLEDLPLWQHFFANLGIRTVTTEGLTKTLAEGKRLARAEFCAPMASLHSHVGWLLDRCDYVFLPFYLERKSEEKEVRRQYCYYTQFAPALAQGALAKKDRILTPLVHYLYGQISAVTQLYGAIKRISPGTGLLAAADAYRKALASHRAALLKWQSLYGRESKKGGDVHVVFLGRPYTIFNPELNKGIPSIFGSLGIKTFYQDMLPLDEKGVGPISPLLKEIHWHYAARILAAAEFVAQRPGAYGVFLTSFKCSPDSFLMEYFQKIMEAAGKPYLILQIDEHDSRVGYETRIEAAVRTFRSHASRRAAAASATEGRGRKGIAPPAGETASESRALPEGRPTPCSRILTSQTADWQGKILVLPNWDNITSRFLTANLKAAGIEAAALPETDALIRKALRRNTGQCIPIHIIAQEFIDYVRQQGLDPARCVLWLAHGSIACNLRLYPYHIKTILEAHGQGMERASVYAGSLSMADISMKLPLGNYLAYMFGGLLRRLGCRIRPYELQPGTTDAVLEKGTAVLEEAFLGKRSTEEAVKEVVSLFKAIPRTEEGRRRPKVAIFGDLYARDNDTINQGLIRFIEAHGAEVITTPYTTYARMIAGPYLRKWLIEGHYLSVLSGGAILGAASQLERSYYPLFNEILQEPEPRFDEDPEKILAPYGLRIEHTGESMDNILKVHYIKKHHPDVALFIQTSPAFCCPSLVTEAMRARIEEVTGVPVVSLTYDGTGGPKNDALIPYLKEICRRKAAQDKAAAAS